MKIAVILYGQTRQLQIAVQSWGILNHHDTDFYVSTWNKTTMKSNQTGFVHVDEITEDSILNFLPNAKIDILDEHDFFWCPVDKCHPNTLKMVFHMKNALKMVRQSKKEYDILILTRTDQFFDFGFSSEKFKMFTEKDRFYGLSPIEDTPDGPFIMDTFFIGDFEVMSKFIKSIPNNLDDPHIGLGKHILSMGLFVVGMSNHIGANANTITIRPNCLGMDTINVEELHKKSLEWGGNI